MSSKALETEDDSAAPAELEVVDTNDAPGDEDQPDAAAVEATDEQDDIVIEGEDEPTSKPVHRIGGFEKRIKKLTGRAEGDRNRRRPFIPTAQR